MMKYMLGTLFVFTAACGSSGTSTMMQDQQDVQAGDDMADPPDMDDPSSPDDTPSDPTRQVSNPLNFAADETFNLFEFETFNIAGAATFPALVDSQISGVATYNGEMFTRIGNQSEFLRGELRLQTGFQAQTLQGRINQMQFAGDDAAGRAAIPAFDRLDITNGSFSGNRLTARLTGTFEEGGFFSFEEPVDEHTVDAALEFVFVDVNTTDGGTEMVGTVDGSITSNLDGERTLVGIVSGDSGF